MHRPIGITILALLAGLAGLFEVWRALVFLGIAKFTFVGQEVSFLTRSGARRSGRCSSRPSGSGSPWASGTFVPMPGRSATSSPSSRSSSASSPCWAGGTMESETVGWLLAIIILFYLNYPGVRNAFIEHELSLMTPEQRAAYDQMQAAQVAMAQASVAGAAAPAAAAPGRPGHGTAAAGSARSAIRLRNPDHLADRTVAPGVGCDARCSPWDTIALSFVERVWTPSRQGSDEASSLPSTIDSSSRRRRRPMPRSSRSM